MEKCGELTTKLAGDVESKFSSEIRHKFLTRKLNFKVHFLFHIHNFFLLLLTCTSRLVTHK